MHGLLRQQEKPQFWKRKPSIVKVNMLLLAHLSRAPVPPTLANDMKYVLKKVLSYTPHLLIPVLFLVLSCGCCSPSPHDTTLLKGSFIFVSALSL